MSSNSFISNVNVLSENLPTLLEFTSEESIENFVTVRVDYHFDKDNVSNTIYDGIQRAIAELDIQNIDDVDDDNETTIVDVFAFSIGKRIDDGLDPSDPSSDVFGPSLTTYLNYVKPSGNTVAYELIEQLASDDANPLYVILEDRVDDYFIDNASTVNSIVINSIENKVNSTEFVNLLNTTFTQQLNTTGSEILNAISGKVSNYFNNNSSLIDSKVTNAITNRVDSTSFTNNMFNSFETALNTSGSQVVLAITDRVDEYFYDNNTTITLHVNNEIDSKIAGPGFTSFVESELTKDDNKLLKEQSYNVAQDTITIQIVEDETYDAAHDILTANDSEIVVNITTDIAQTEVDAIVVGKVEEEATSQVTPIVTGIVTNEATVQVGNIVDEKVTTQATDQVALLAPPKVAEKVAAYNLQPDVINTVNSRLTTMGFETVVEDHVQDEYETTLNTIVDEITHTDGFQVALIEAKTDIDDKADTRIEDINEVIDEANSTINDLYSDDLTVKKATWEAEMALMRSSTRLANEAAALQANRMNLMAIEIEETNNNLAIITSDAEQARDTAVAAANVSTDMLDSVKDSISVSSFAFLSQDFYGGN